MKQFPTVIVASKHSFQKYPSKFAVNSCHYSDSVCSSIATIIACKPNYFLKILGYCCGRRWLLLGLFASTVWAYDFDRLQSILSSRFGEGRVTALREWQGMLIKTKPMVEKEKLRRINDFFNRRIVFDDDMTIWNQSDYWATPLETIGRGRGDCEDFTIVKYYSLREAGVPVSKLRLVYVKARLSGPDGPYLQAHMVLAYYATPNAEPLVLDNLIPEIKPASQRSELQPIFSFNSEAIWNGVAGNAARGAGGTGKLSRWQDLLKRARDEGFD